MTVLLRRALAFTLLLLLLQAVHAEQEAPEPLSQRSESMKNDGEYVPPVDALVPYQSAIASFRRKLPEDEMIAFAISIMSPAESYATMIQRELESKPGYGITVTVTPLRNARAGEVETWRIYGVSKPLRVGDLSEDEHHAIAGWAFEVAGYFQSTLQNFAYRL